MWSSRPAAAVERMQPVRGHLATGLKQSVTVRVYGGGSGSLEIDGRAYAFGSRAEAVAMFDEYLRRALERAGGPLA